MNYNSKLFLCNIPITFSKSFSVYMERSLVSVSNDPGRIFDYFICKNSPARDQERCSPGCRFGDIAKPLIKIAAIEVK